MTTVHAYKPAASTLPRLSRRWLFALFLIGTLTRLWYVPRVADTVLHNDGEMLATAQSIVATGEFANPFAPIPTGPTAHVAPVPTFIIAAALWAFPDDKASSLALRLVAALAVGLQVAAVYGVARMYGLPDAVARLGALIGAVYPASPWAELNGVWDAPYVALALLVAAGSVAWLDHKPQPRRAAVVGGILGFTLLVSPVVLLFVLGVRARRLLAAFRTRRLPMSLTSCVAFVLAAAMVLAPWTVRNRMTLGHWMLVRDNLGIELAVSNADIANAVFERNTPQMQTHPMVTLREAMQVRVLGEVAYNKQRMREALRWIGGHPAHFVSLTLDRIGYFWSPPDQGAPRTWLFRGLLALAAAGIVLLFRDGRGPSLDLAFGMLAFSSIYALVQQIDRYPYPIWWLIYLFVAVAVAAIWARITARTPAQRGSATA